jgi:glucokinase
MKVIGIDIGGTNIKGALFNGATGECLRKNTAPTRDGESIEGLPAWVMEVRGLVEEFERHAGGLRLSVGISAPGLARRDASCIGWMPGRMAGLEGFVWSDHLDRPARVLNDAHAALMGEVWQGAAKGCEDVVMLTLGTGVGGAAICGGRLLQGHTGRAGHFGHITVDHYGPPTIMGCPGGLEDAIGNASIAHRSQGRFTMTRDLIEAVKSGDTAANEIWNASVRALAAGMVSLINAFDPEVFILGGGIAAGAGDELKLPLERWLGEFEWRPAGQRVRVVNAALDEWAGAYGAARFAVDGQAE